MNCPHCKKPMTALLFSTVCDHCDGEPLDGDKVEITWTPTNYTLRKPYTATMELRFDLKNGDTKVAEITFYATFRKSICDDPKKTY